MKPYELEIVSDEEVGLGGFLHLRRLRLRNLRPDGSRSAEWLCDFVERNKGIDAVVVALYRDAPAGGPVEVLLRDGLRPALLYGRPASRVPIADAHADGRFLFTEVVAGIIEEGEVGELAVRHRAADEAWEEAGERIAPESIVLLGSTYPSPGMTAEKFWFAAARVHGDHAVAPEGDGSPMEEGAETRWLPLDEALARCRSGAIEDAKTELVLRRLADHLAGPGA